MYAFEDLPLDPIDPGTNVLVAGPAMGGTRQAFLRMVSPAPGDEGALLISTNDPAGALVDDLAGATDVDRRAVGVVDAAGGGPVEGDERVRTVSSPSDLTGMGMAFTDLYEAFVNGGVRRVRTGIDSVSTLLIYTDVQTIFRLLHVTTGRVSTADGLGVFVIHPDSHDDQTTQTLTQLFDARVEVRESGAGRQLRVRGLPDQPREWVTF